MPVVVKLRCKSSPTSVLCVVQTLAVDASIWLTQFVKAMRDRDGNMMHNAHILGVFRRVCRVQYTLLHVSSPRPTTG